ncbi:hypothetical protein HSX10_06845 [Winogradskyella undariae]|uniref:hypothetical protein n=1 Tax=Winogradskyella TaxID=286104 RepID=UPI00156B35B3|nr:MULTISPECIES: hypothetical protein [Winogradskyella]NRR91278.1 hypothetical protein [Winogradskyella undariae]QXP80458.1 hypothetical protein H0I32_07515 [Winogradskyella sp. HaHa_3_26]
MKPKTTKALPCAIFGHNYVKSKTNIDHTIEMTCTHCDTVVVTDHHGNFENNTVANKQISETLQELYRLTKCIAKTKVAS